MSSHSDSDSELVQPYEDPEEDPESPMSDAISEEEVVEERLLRVPGMGDDVVDEDAEDTVESARICARDMRFASPRTLDTKVDEDDEDEAYDGGGTNDDGA